MFKYQNCTCPYCGQPLLPTDDLAVCPECGTPHHRACYKEHGACANTALHGTGFEWTPPAPVIADDRAQSGVTCPHCGAACQSQAKFCDRCGTPLDTAAPENASEPAATAWPMELSERDLNERSFDGIPVRDWLTYISTSTGYYLYYFKLQDDTGRKVGFTWSAMFFPVLYFLYRKVWSMAALAAASELLLRLPLVFNAYFVPQGYTLGLTAAAWTTIANISYYVLLGINFLWGIFAVHLYRKASAKRIAALRQSCPDEQQYHARLARISGPSRAAVLCVLTPYAALMVAAAFVMGLFSRLL